MRLLVSILLIFFPILVNAQIQVSGRVLDAGRQPIESTLVSITEQNVAVSTNKNGQFEVQCFAPCLIEISHLNYGTKYFTIEKSQVVEISLEQKSITLGELEVTSTQQSDLVQGDIKRIERVTTLFGEKDIIKYLVTLPGISSINAFDAGISVRGGSTTENAFLVNGAGIADPKHISSLVTSYDAYILNESNIYKSAFPTQYNGYLSSYIDMSTDLESINNPQAEVSLGLISSSLKAATPFGKSQNHKVAVSGRKSYLHFVSDMYKERTGDEIVPKYGLNDFTFAYQGSLKRNWKVALFGLVSSDDMPIKLSENDRHQLNWGSKSGVVGVRKKFSERNEFEVRFGINGSESQNSSRGQLTQEVRATSKKYSGNVVYKRHFVDRWIWNTGIQYENNQYQINNDPDASSLIQQSTQRVYGLSSAYSEVTYFVNDQITVDAGVNGTYFDGEVTHTDVSPRFKLHYGLNSTNIWMDYARTLQFEEKYSFYTVRTPIDSPIPLSQNNQPATSDQVSMGINKRIDGLNLTSSVFYKKMLHLKDFVAESRTSLDYSSINMMEGVGRAYGIETEVTYATEKIYVGVNYTWTDSKRTFDQINGGNTFSPPFDIQYSASANGSYTLNDHWTFSAMWVYRSGIYITIPEGIAVAKDITQPNSIVNYIPVYNNRYNFQLPASHRLDLNVDYFRTFKKHALKASIGIYNTYDRDNADFVYFEVQQSEDYFVSFKAVSKVVLPFVQYLSFTFYLNNHGRYDR